MLSKQAIYEYMEIYKSVHGIEIPFEKALEEATALIRLFKVVYRPVPKNWYEAINKKDKNG